MKKVGICVPSGDMVHTDFAMCLAAMCALQDQRFIIINNKGSLVHKNRNNGVRECQRHGCDFMLTIDSDMTFPPDTLKRLMRWDKDIVGATYMSRAKPYVNLAKPLDNQRQEYYAGAHEVEALPTGCLMVRVSLFDELKRPYFRMPFEEETDTEAEKEWGEDYDFCRRVRALGKSIWMDVDLSFEVGHLGQTVHRIENEATAANQPPVARRA